MSELTFSSITIPQAKMNGESSLPPIANYNGKPDDNGNSSLGYYEGLYLGYGNVSSPFPYRMQDMYTRELYDAETMTAVLENEYLRAEFYPEWGGKLASLFDKEKGRELLFKNPVIRPCNLAIRNAWTSGGIEFNIGERGHHNYTCSPLFTARASLDDGTPVLRFYEYDRIRKSVWQMDFFLPDGSRMLFARMRIVNTNPFVTPTYWWSNIAVPEIKGARVIVPAHRTYIREAVNVGITDVPVYDGIDVTYPVNSPNSIDFFFKLDEGARRYEAQVDPSGYGFIQTSTDMLKGRKLFVWGQGPGGDRWQSYLTADGYNGRYVELQAGLACTQYEHIPMPPRTSWEWLEGYGAINADPEKAHGDWDDAVNEVGDKLEEILSRSSMNELFLSTKEASLRPADEVVLHGSGWAALENLRRSRTGEEIMCPHLDFGDTGEAQDFWLSLLDGKLKDEDPDRIPASWMLDDKWSAMLEDAAASFGKDDWYTHLQLGMIYLVSSRHKDARRELIRSIKLKRSAWAIYGLSRLCSLDGSVRKSAAYALEAAEMMPGDLSLAKEAMRALNEAGMYGKTVEFYESSPESVKNYSRAILLYSDALIKVGRYREAEKLITAGGGLVLADIREGETLLSDMWYEIQEKKALEEGKTFDRESAVPPEKMDYRMFVRKKQFMKK